MATPNVVKSTVSGGKKVLQWGGQSFTNAVILIILILIALAAIRYYGPRLWRLITIPDYDWDVGESVVLTKERKQEIENLARAIKQDIEETPYCAGNLENWYEYLNPINYVTVCHTGKLYRKADALTDNELRHLARYYKRQLPEHDSLYSALDGDYFWMDEKDSLMTKLYKIGMT